MSGRNNRITTSSEDWIKRYKIAFIVSLILIASVLLVLFAEYRAQMLDVMELADIAGEITASTIETGVAL